VDTPVQRRLTVIGAGYVGLVTAVGLAEMGHRVRLVEVRADRLAMLRDGRSPIFEAGLDASLTVGLAAGRLAIADHPDAEAEIALVCVGTPILADGRSDLSQLETALRELGPLLGPGVPLVIRSTVPPGSTQRAVAWSGVPSSRVFTNPEFLRQGTALADFRHPSRVVIGRFADADPTALAMVEALFATIDAPRLIVDIAASEIIKNGANAFLALKLSFANELASLSEEYGTDVDDVLAGITLDPRIGSQYMRPSFGFGGSCLPKELQALATAGGARGLAMHVTQAASDANTAQQVRFADRIEGLLGGLAGRRIAVLGLAFKAGTDDVRDSPAVALVARLIAAGADVRAHDPQAAANARRVIPDLTTAPTVEDAIDGADAVVIATEWPLYRDLDWAGLRLRLAGPLVVDGRRLLDAGLMRNLGYRYETVGSATADPGIADRQRTAPVADTQTLPIR
jgi:UDPglucose 6-dehydrogenase